MRLGGPKHIAKRIIGIETEFGTNKLASASYFPSSIINDVMAYILVSYAKRGVIPWDAKRDLHGRHFLANQAQSYCDRNNHLEYATPECLGPREAALYETAGCVIVAEGLKLLREARSGLRKVRFYKNNRNCEYHSPQSFRDTWSTHANFLTPRRITFRHLRQYLLPFLLTRSFLIGNAWLEFTPQRYIGFLLSQRSSLLTVDEGPDTTGDNRAFINTREEPHADDKIWRRVHDISGNSNMSEWQLLLKYGTYDLMLMLVEEEGFLADPPVINDGRLPTVAARGAFFNADIRSRRPIFLNDGRRWSAINFQQFFIEETHRYFREGRGPFTDERRLVLELWERTVDAMARWDLCFLAGILDWAALLHYYLMPLFESLGLNIERFLAPLPYFYKRAGCDNTRYDTRVPTKKGSVKLIDHLLRLFVEFSNVEMQESPYGLLKKQGLIHSLFDKEEIALAVDNPPLRTRAAWRAKILRWVEQEGRKLGLELHNGAWDSITLLRHESPGYGYQVFRTIYNFNPYLFRVREMEKGHPTDLLKVKEGATGG